MKQYQVIHCPITSATETAPDTLAELAPLIDYLHANIPVTEATTFERGTVIPDGRLDLCKQGLGYAGCSAIAKALTNNTTVASLLLGTNGIGNLGAAEVAKLIERNKHLEIIYLGCNKIEDTGIEVLAQSLANNTSVTGLWLKRNPIGFKGAKAIAEMLKQNQSIRTLDLVNTQLGYEGLASILEVLIHKNRTVERLYLGGNQIDAEAVQLIATLLKTNPNIKALMLNVNHLGDEGAIARSAAPGAIALAQALQSNSTLTELGLASNAITSTGSIPLIESITVHPKLVNIDFGYSPSTQVLGAKANCIGDKGAEAIGKMLTLNQTLVQLNLQRNEITERGQALIIAGLEHNTMLRHLVLDGKQNLHIKTLLQRNQNLHPHKPQISRDVALIRSVYRTK